MKTCLVRFGTSSTLRNRVNFPLTAHLYDFIPQDVTCIIFNQRTMWIPFSQILGGEVLIQVLSRQLKIASFWRLKWLWRRPASKLTNKFKLDTMKFTSSSRSVNMHNPYRARWKIATAACLHPWKSSLRLPQSPVPWVKFWWVVIFTVL